MFTDLVLIQSLMKYNTDVEPFERQPSESKSEEHWFMQLQATSTDQI